jgi:para-nitrobenzyl esterase
MENIKIDTGLITGTEIGATGKEIRIFKGIPYAAPPVGELRWQAPRPVEAWSGVRDCTKFSLTAIQNPMRGGPPTGASEDCLYLNVLTPAKTSKDKLPVMVWMHGGMYALGSGNDLLSNNYRLPQQGIVLVTVNMRLDVIGLLAHPQLSAESPNSVSGNYMFLDMIAALEWVQKNIANFGGDPGNVTIFGESGGGAKVSTLVASPLTKGLYHKAICESGTATARTWWTGQSLGKLEAMGERIFEILDVKTLEAARALPCNKVYEANAQLTKESGSQWGIVDAAVDGWFLLDTPLNIFRAGKMNPTPLINCANAGELTAMFPMLVPGYVEMFGGMAKAGVDGYACIFDQVPAKWRQEGMTHTPHGLELLYVFGDYDNITGWWEMTYAMMSMMGASLKSKVPGLNETDKYVSESMMRYWTQFARTGNPNGGSLPSWPVYTALSNSYLYINETLEVKTGFSEISK